MDLRIHQVVTAIGVTLIAGLGVAIQVGTASAQTTAPASPLTQRPNIPTSRESRFSRSADAQITYEEGRVRYRDGRLPEAEQSFKQLLQDDPTDIDAYYYLGLTQLDQNRPADAVPNFSQTLRLDPTFDEVRGARATALIRLGRYDEAQQDIDALAQSPAFAGYTEYLRGQLAYAKGDLDAAAAAFAKAKAASGPEAAPAGFYEGLTYLRMKNQVRARQSFAQGGAANAERDPTLSAAARQLDDVLARQPDDALGRQPGGAAPEEKPWELQLTVAYEYDSNVIQLGSNIEVPEGISRQNDSRIVVQPTASYKFINNDNMNIGVEGSGYFAWQVDLNEFDIASYQAGPAISYKLSDKVWANFRYAFNYITLGGDRFLTRNIFTPGLVFVGKDNFTSLFYQFQTRQFDETFASTAERDDLDRDGYTQSVGVLQDFTVPSLFRDAGNANVDINYRFDAQEARGSDYDGYFNTLGVTYLTPLPFWNLRADLGATFGHEYYTHSNSLDDNGNKRLDWEYSLSAGLTHKVSKEMAFRVDYTYTDHHSNVETVNTGGDERRPFEYDRHVFGVRMILTF